MRCINYECSNDLTAWELKRINAYKFSKTRFCIHCRLKKTGVNRLRCLDCGGVMSNNDNRIRCVSCANKIRKIRRDIVLKGMPILEKICLKCNNKYNTKYKTQLYCSKKCYYIIRKRVHTAYSREQYRVKTGYYKRIIKKLVECGYTVIPPNLNSTI